MVIPLAYLYGCCVFNMLVYDESLGCFVKVYENVYMGGITLNTINNMVYNNHFNSFTLTDSINSILSLKLITKYS